MTASSRGPVLVDPHDCCGMHSMRCEPPSELCCHDCVEVAHPDHPRGVLCVLDVAAMVYEHTGQARDVEAGRMVQGLRDALAHGGGERAPGTAPAVRPREKP